MEFYALILVYTGLVISSFAWLWLLVRAFQHRIWWGLGGLLLPPIAFIFAQRHAQRAIGPLLLFILGGLVIAVPITYSLVGPTELNLRQELHDRDGLVLLATKALQGETAHGWMEGRALYIQLGGLTLTVFAWLWLLERAFHQSRAWGLVSLVAPPMGLIYAARYPRRGTGPLFLMFLFLFVAALPALYTLYIPLDLGPVEKLVDGQRHLTLTGWDRKDYSILKLKPDVVVLQMANPDVTDLSLESLREMKLLQELDLSGTQVSDAGLGVLNDLPALAKLRLARTKITDKGFRDTLFAKDSLMLLDLTATAVARDSGNAWREAKPGRRILQ
jgi:hypothetical protein